MDAFLNSPPGEITYMFQSINTVEWYDLIRIGAIAIILLVSTLYLYYNYKAKETEDASPKRQEKGD